MPVSWAMLVAPTTTSLRMASWMVRTAVDAFQTMPMETVRVGLPIQLNRLSGGTGCAEQKGGFRYSPSGHDVPHH